MFRGRLAILTFLSLDLPYTSTSSTPKGGAVRDAVNPAHTTHGVDSAKTSYLKDRSRDGNVLGQAAAAAGSRW